MAVDNAGFLTLSVAEALRLGERELRDLFVRVVIELEGEMADTFTERVDFLRDGRRPETMTTREMREAILKYQYWFNPKPKAPVE